MLSQDVAANVCTKSSSFSVASTAPSVLKTRGAQHEERLLSGRYVITTSLDKKTASTAQAVGHYKALQSVERRFRVLKDFLALRPVFHYTEKRVRGHVAICVLAAVLEAVMSIDLRARKLTDPDLEGQHLSARRALRGSSGSGWSVSPTRTAMNVR